MNICQVLNCWDSPALSHTELQHGVETKGGPNWNCQGTKASMVMSTLKAELVNGVTELQLLLRAQDSLPSPWEASQPDGQGGQQHPALGCMERQSL